MSDYQEQNFKDNQNGPNQSDNGQGQNNSCSISQHSSAFDDSILHPNLIGELKSKDNNNKQEKLNDTQILNLNNNKIINVPKPTETQQQQQQDNNSPKSLQDLMTEFQEQNKCSDGHRHQFENIIKDIKDQYTKTSKIYVNSNSIDKWSLNDILEWSKMKTSLAEMQEEKRIVEMLAVIQRAVEIQEGHKIRDSQLISIIQLELKEKSKGRLAQIFTGEGKSLIVSCLAVINCLKNKNVDIVTSSDVLAKRDSEQKQQFYKIFGLQCSHNIDKELSSQIKVKPCYADNINIVYGTSHAFQADILNHEFYQRNTRGNRKFDYLIVDEVDSMFVDSRDQRTLLTSNQSGFSKILKILNRMWIDLCNIEPIVNPETQEIRLINCQLNVEETIHVAVYLTRVIRNLIYGDKDCKGMKETLPKFMVDYIIVKAAIWALNAVRVKYQWKKGVEYKVENNEIRPIDYQNTGITQVNTQYSDGIHQFLQMKENLTTTAPNLVTNYSSNVGFFQTYKENLVGLTGTLGSDSVKNFLQTIYDVDLVYIPTFKKRLLKELPAVLVQKQETWRNKICEEVEIESQKNKRCCLIICETVLETEKYLQCNAIKGEEEEKNIQKFTTSGCVIVSTNLAGRGTDIKISKEVEQQGGLHVILTFLPLNSRVQEQAFGRAGRMGQSGTAKIIYNATEVDQNILEEHQDYIMKQLKESRNQSEKTSISFAKRQVDEVLKLDNIFQRFSQKLKSFGINKNKDEYNVSKALEFRFGIFLDIQGEKHSDESGSLNVEKYEPDFKKFLEEIKDDYQNNRLFIKSEDMISQGINEVQKGKYAEALQYFEDAERMDPNNPLPHYQKIFTKIKKQDINIDEINKELEQFKQKYKLKQLEIQQLDLLANQSKEIQLKHIRDQIKLERDKLKMQQASFTYFKESETPQEYIPQTPLKVEPETRKTMENPETIERINPTNYQIDSLDNFDTDSDLQGQKNLKYKPMSLSKFEQEELKRANEIQVQKGIINTLINIEKKIIDGQSCKHNLNCIKKETQMYQAIAKQLELNFEAIKNGEGSTIEVETKNPIELTVNMSNPEIFQDKREVRQYFSDVGVEEVFYIKIKKKKQNCSSYFVIIAGVVQFVAGVWILCQTAGFGAAFGIGMMVEGFKDIIQGISAATKGLNIDLGDYFLKKGINYLALTISASFIGFFGLMESLSILPQALMNLQYKTYQGYEYEVVEEIKIQLNKHKILTLEDKEGKKIICQEDFERYQKEKNVPVNEETMKKQLQDEFKQQSNLLIKEIKTLHESEQTQKAQLKKIKKKIQEFLLNLIKTKYNVIIDKLAYQIQKYKNGKEVIDSFILTSFNNIKMEKYEEIFKKVAQNVTNDIYQEKSEKSIEQLIEEFLQEFFQNIQRIENFQNEVDKNCFTYPNLIDAFNNQLQKLKDQSKVRKQEYGAKKEEDDKVVAGINLKSKNLNETVKELQSESAQINQIYKQLEDEGKQLDTENDAKVDEYNQKVKDCKDRKKKYDERVKLYKQNLEIFDKERENFDLNKQSNLSEINKQINIQNQNQTLITEARDSIQFLNKIKQILSESDILGEDEVSILNLTDSNISVFKSKIEQQIDKKYEQIMPDFIAEFISVIKSEKTKQRQETLQKDKEQLIKQIYNEIDLSIIDNLFDRALSFNQKPNEANYLKNVEQINKQLTKQKYENI